MKYKKMKRILSKEEAANLRNTKASNKLADEVGGVEPTTFIDFDTDLPFALYSSLSESDTRTLTAEVMRNRKNFTGVIRAKGMKSKSAVFGNIGPSGPMKRFTPTSAAWSWNSPESHNALSGYASLLADKFIAEGPAEVCALHESTKATIHQDWQIASTCWTSGIVNDTANLFYHYDKNNVEGTWSAMVVMRAGVKGGYLHIPEYELTLPCNNGDVLFFPGMHVLHGVTPMEKSLPSGYRFSAVYYSIKTFVDREGSAGSLHAAQVRQSVLAEGLIERHKLQGLIANAES